MAAAELENRKGGKQEQSGAKEHTCGRVLVVELSEELLLATAEPSEIEQKSFALD